MSDKVQPFRQKCETFSKCFWKKEYFILDTVYVGNLSVIWLWKFKNRIWLGSVKLMKSWKFYIQFLKFLELQKCIIIIIIKKK